MTEISLEGLLGRRVLDRDGHAIGRLQEVRAEVREGHCFVIEYLVGLAGLRERLSIAGLRGGLSRHGYKVRWDQLDLSDPQQPRLLCPLADLAAYSGGRARRPAGKRRRAQR